MLKYRYKCFTLLYDLYGNVIRLNILHTNRQVPSLNINKDTSLCLFEIIQGFIRILCILL